MKRWLNALFAPKVTPISKAAQRRARLAVEPLEDRCLMAAATAVGYRLEMRDADSNTLVVSGTGKNDLIRILPVPGRKLLITAGELELANGKNVPSGVHDVGIVSIESENIRDIKVLGFSGNDRILIDSRLTLSCQLDGGKGSDTLQGGSGHDTLEGGEGDDLLRGGAGNDRLEGDQDQDQLYGEQGLDSLFGGEGIDFLDTGTPFLNQNDDTGSRAYDTSKQTRGDPDFNAYYWQYYDQRGLYGGASDSRGALSGDCHFEAIVASLNDKRGLSQWIEYKGNGVYGVRLYSRQTPSKLEEVLVEFNGKLYNSDPYTGPDRGPGNQYEFWTILLHRAYLKQRNIDPSDPKWFERPGLSLGEAFRALTGQNFAGNKLPVKGAYINDLLNGWKCGKPVLVYADKPLSPDSRRTPTDAFVDDRGYFVVLSVSPSKDARGRSTDWIVKLYDPFGSVRSFFHEGYTEIREIRWSALWPLLRAKDGLIIGNRPLHRDGTYADVALGKRPTGWVEGDAQERSPFDLKATVVDTTGRLIPGAKLEFARYGEARLWNGWGTTGSDGTYQWLPMPGKRDDVTLSYELRLPDDTTLGRLKFKVSEVIVNGVKIDLNRDVTDGWITIPTPAKGGSVDVQIKMTPELPPAPTGMWFRKWNDGAYETMTIEIAGRSSLEISRGNFLYEVRGTATYEYMGKRSHGQIQGHYDELSGSVSIGNSYYWVVEGINVLGGDLSPWHTPWARVPMFA